MVLPAPRYLLIFISIFISVFAVAQKSADSTKVETLFGQGNLKATGYGGVQIGFSKLKDVNLMLFSIEGGIVVNKKVIVGAEFTGIYSSELSNVYYERHDEEVEALTRGFYGGVKVEPVLRLQKVVHLSFPIVVGGGELMYRTKRKYAGGSGDLKRAGIDSDGFVYAEPGIKLEINLSRYIRFGTSVTYRITSALNLNSTPDDAFSGIATKIGFAFGKF